MRQRGRIDSVTAAVGDAAATLRRRREARQPYVKVWAEEGEGRLLDPASPEAEALIETATGMVDVVDASRLGASTRARGAA